VMGDKNLLLLTYSIEGVGLLFKQGCPDPPSRHHLSFDRPFDKLTVLSTVEGLMALSKA